ncbi:YncE family protein [uncultured Lactobacillus sp.]|uniref:YncE family protein n=1 Tax=uncultured Lactobacillus sp. TaxID=153152 RepID=UPI002633AD2A|nr:hypothetical protein [uncultured Lactobacillus sp.]
MKKSKILLKLFFVLLLLGGLTAGAYYLYERYQNNRQAQASFYSKPILVKAKDGTSISAGHYSFPAFKKKLSDKYPAVYEAAFESPLTSKVGANYIIPGQRVTRSFNFQTNKVNSTDSMVPQGLTIAGKYLLITAYDSQHQHRSVIYVLNKKTGKYIKTVQVSGSPHLGGIAYDPVAKNIWITGSQQDQSALMSFSLKKLEKYDFAKNKKPIAYDHVIGLPTIQRASCVTYYDDQLFVGFFNQSENGQIASYPIARQKPFKGTITSDQIKAVTGQVSWALGSGSAAMDQQIQGIAFYQNYVILSQSYGSKDSKLFFFPITALDSLDEKNAEKVVVMPPYLEQIYVNDGQLLMLFESGAKPYAKNNIMKMDRILSANINALLGS